MSLHPTHVADLTVTETGLDAGSEARGLRPGLVLAGRILLALIFFVSGAAKLLNPGETAAHMASAGIPNPDTLALIAGIAEIAGGLGLVLGLLTRVAAVGLILFMIPTTAIFHNFWAYAGPEMKQQMIELLKNLTTIGGLAILAAVGAGRYSLDSKWRRRRLARVTVR